jgi:hypothetical protein
VLHFKRLHRIIIRIAGYILVQSLLYGTEIAP